MSGGNPEFVVSVPPSGGQPTLLLPQQVEAPANEEPDDGEPVARISLRLPNPVKAKVDEAATRAGISTNAWLMRAVLEALGDRRRNDGWRQLPQPPATPGVFGPNGPFGPHGPFGPNGIFGTPTSGGRHRRRFGEDDGGRNGGVQGWVR